LDGNDRNQQAAARKGNAEEIGADLPVLVESAHGGSLDRFQPGAGALDDGVRIEAGIACADDAGAGDGAAQALPIDTEKQCDPSIKLFPQNRPEKGTA